MNLQEIINHSRLVLDDPEMPGSGDDTDSLWSNDELTLYVNDAMDEACLRSKLITDSSTAAICDIALVADQAEYTLDERIIWVQSAHQDGKDGSLEQTTERILDRALPQWRQMNSVEEPSKYLIDMNSHKIRLVPAPSVPVADTLKLTVWRTQLASLDYAQAATEIPEIPAIHHLGLIDWVVRQCYLKKDVDTYDPDASARHEAIFESRFGQRPDAWTLNHDRTHGRHRVPARFY